MAARKKTTEPDKIKVHEALRAALHAALGVMAHSAEDARKGAVHEENRSEGDKDMRATEQSYVARGQAMRTEQLAEDVARFETITVRKFAPEAAVGITALVKVSIDEEVRWFYLVAQGGGMELDVEGIRVTVLTPSSPAGQSLIGKFEGDEFEIRAAGKVRTWEVLAVR